MADQSRRNSQGGKERKSMKAMMRQAELGRLRRFFLPIIALKQHRRRREHARESIPLQPPPEELARFVSAHCSYISKWPGDVLLEVCKDPVYRFAFAGEVISYLEEPVRSHGLILILKGGLGVMRRGESVTAAQVAKAMERTYAMSPTSRRAGFESPGRLKGIQKDALPEETYDAPYVRGEMLCLVDGINMSMTRATMLTDYAVINVANIRNAINKHLSPEALNATFNREVRLARKTLLREFFPQTPPLMGRSWICADMSPLELSQIINALEAEVAVPGQDIVTQGQPGATMYFVRRGTTQVVSNGKPVPFFLRPGDVFGDMAVLFSEKRMATIRATTVVDLWVLSKKALEKVIRHSSVKDKIIAAAAMRRADLVAKNQRGSVLPLLSRHSMFSKCTPETLNELVAKAIPRVFPAGKVLVSGSHRSREMILIVNGLATSQDVYCSKYGPGSFVGDMCLCPHRSIETIASNTMVDAFVFPDRTLKRVLGRAGLLGEFVEVSEVRLLGLARMRGLTATLLTTRISQRPEHLIVPEEVRHERQPHQLDEAAPSSDHHEAHHHHTPPRSRSPARSMTSAAPQGKYAQPDESLVRNAHALSASHRAAQAQADRLLHGADAAASVELPDEAAFRVALKRARRPNRRRRGGDGSDSSSSSEGDDMSSGMEGGDVTHDFFESGKWRDHGVFSNLLSADNKFVADLAHMPSSRHHAYSALTIKAITAHGRKDGYRVRMPLAPAVSRPSTGSKSRQHLLEESTKSVADRMKSLCSTVVDGHDHGTQPLRRQFHPVHPFSYAPVLPLSVQPASETELAKTISDPSAFGPSMHEAGDSDGDSDLSSEGNFYMFHNVPVDERRFVPNAEELDEFMAEVLQGSAGMPSVKEGGEAADAPVVDRDFVREEWASINESIPLEPPLTFAHYSAQPAPSISRVPGEKHRRHHRSDRASAKAQNDSASSVLESQPAKHVNSRRGMDEDAVDSDSAHDSHPHVEPSDAGGHADERHSKQNTNDRSPRGQPHRPGGRPAAAPVRPAPYGLPERPPTLHSKQDSRPSTGSRGPVPVPPQLSSTTPRTASRSSDRTASNPPNGTVHAATSRAERDDAARRATSATPLRVRYVPIGGSRPGSSRGADSGRSAAVIGPDVPTAAATPLQKPLTTRNLRHSSAQAEGKVGTRFARDFVSAWAKHQQATSRPATAPRDDHEP